MTDSWCRRRLTKENEYFTKKCEEVVDQIRTRVARKVSPISGEPLINSLIHNVEVLRDPKTGGIWLDQNQLENLIASVQEESRRSSWKDILRFELD